jgi:hypothetical protein
VLSKLRSRVTYANVVASVALFIALGGTSYGLATGSIGGREIKNNSVTGRDVHNNSLTGADIRNDRLTGADILESSVGKVPNAAAADTANSANTANVADAANIANSVAGEYFAVVNPDGTLARGTANVSSQRANMGQYYVSIDRDVAQCFFVATLGGTATANTTGQIVALVDPTFSSKAVFVVTRDSGGSTGDRTFTLHIRC